jgi:tRNA dimethylallyltransferase
MSAEPAPPPLVLVGPTASGKSAVALELARRRRRQGGRPVELISCDSMQVYRGMDIGTATATPAERSEVPHHLLDVVDPSEEFHVARFQQLVRVALHDIAARGADAVLVGGTVLYVRAVVDDLTIPGRFPEVAARLAAEPDVDVLRRQLEELDPIAAARVPPGNRRRLMRALEVTIGSGRPFSDSGPGLGAYPPVPFRMVGLRVDRAELTGRIRARYERQLADGFLDEVRERVTDPAGWSRTASEALGYRELARHVEGSCSLEEALDEAVRRTRRFAVRQERWFRRDPRIAWVDAPGPLHPAAAVADGIDDWWSDPAGDGEADHRSGSVPPRTAEPAPGHGATTTSVVTRPEHPDRTAGGS